MTRLIDLLADAMPADVWLELANQLEQWRASSNSIEDGYHAQKACELLSSEVQL